MSRTGMTKIGQSLLEYPYACALSWSLGGNVFISLLDPDSRHSGLRIGYQFGFRACVSGVLDPVLQDMANIQVVWRFAQPSKRLLPY